MLTELLLQLSGLGGVHGVQYLLAAHGIWIVILIYRLVDVINALQMAIGRWWGLPRLAQLTTEGVALFTADSDRAERVRPGEVRTHAVKLS